MNVEGSVEGEESEMWLPDRRFPIWTAWNCQANQALPGLVMKASQAWGHIRKRTSQLYAAHNTRPDVVAVAGEAVEEEMKVPEVYYISCTFDPMVKQWEISWICPHWVLTKALNLRDSYQPEGEERRPWGWCPKLRHCLLYDEQTSNNQKFGVLL